MQALIMKTLSLVASKGGVGKSTLAACLAVEGVQRGLSVVVADLDPQGSLVDWRKSRTPEEPYYANTTTARLGEGRLLLAEDGADLLIIDTPPGHLATLEAAANESDALLVPVKPSPVDLRAIGPTIEIIKRVGVPFAFVLNMTVSRSLVTDEAREVLAEFGPVAPGSIAHRVDYARAMMAGMTAPEVSQGAAAAEVSALYDFIETIGGSAHG